MKTCGYCGRENEDAAVVCRECGMSEFPVPAAGKAQASHAEAMTVAEPEPPTPDVALDQEAAICPFCLFPNLPDREWCKQCGAPFNMDSVFAFILSGSIHGSGRGCYTESHCNPCGRGSDRNLLFHALSSHEKLHDSSEIKIG